MAALLQSSAEFMDYLDGWSASLPTLTLQEAIPEPAKAAMISVDVTNGFCKFGTVSSSRIANIILPITQLFCAVWDHGVRELVLTQDTHEPNAVEFNALPAHCVRGTAEADAVDEFKALPFFSRMQIIQKNSLSSSINTIMPDWLTNHPEINTFIVVGDCTDLCIYQAAMHLRLDANACQLQRRVIVPLNCIDTYDLPTDIAVAAGRFPHPGDLMHVIFAYNMALNGVEVIKQIA